jgi:alpha galactosidase A-like protein/alpha galactosidase C-like protein/alpha-galactosidase-like protein/alpha-galactosidase-like CBM13-containing protein
MRRLTVALAATLIAVPLTAAVTVRSAPARAQDNGTGLTPAMGWSSWSFIRSHPTAAKIEAQADALKSSGLTRAGYQYVNLDDFWYVCPGSQGPAVDSFGRWVIDTSKFPPDPVTGHNGIQAVAAHVHSLGLKFGLYVTPGISRQAVAQNTPIEGTPYHAGDIATSASENNYNCGGMTGIDYSKPGAQAFIDSWADQFASWGVDYLKLDGVGSFDIPDVQAWSDALRQTGRPIHLELSNSLNIADAATWARLSNGWRTGGDVECYGCESGGSSYPLTDWQNVSSRFSQVAAWQPYGGPGGFNDYDSIEVGNGANDGLTLDERKAQLSLWALASSPLILGTDLTSLDPGDLGLLKNREVIAVDQDATDASRIASTATSQVFAKAERSGDAVVGLFNTGSQPQVISTSASALGLPGGTGYLLDDLWAHHLTQTAGTISASVPPHGVALYRVVPDRVPALAPPSATLDTGGAAAATGGEPATVTSSFTDNGDLAARQVRLAVTVPAGWTVTPSSPATFAAVKTGQTVQASFAVTAPAPDGLFGSGAVTGTAAYTWAGKTRQSLTVTRQVTVTHPVQPPYRTFSSATDAPAAYGQSGQQFGIIGAGADLWTGSDAYSTIYQPGAVNGPTTITTMPGLAGFAKAGIIVRDDLAGSGTTPEGAVLFASPSGGVQLEWASGGGTHIDSVTPANGSIPASLPVWLRLERDGSTYTGYYSYDGQSWLAVGSAAVPGQAAAQDAGLFVTSHASGQPGEAAFTGFTVAGGATPPPLATSYEAEAPANALAGGAVTAACTTCSGGTKVGFVGSGGTLTVGDVTVPSDGTYQVTIAYTDGSDTGRQAQISVDGGSPRTVTFTPTGSFSTVGAMTVPLALTAGPNTIEFGNPSAFAPDFDRLIVPPAPG